MSRADRFLKTCKREKADATPIWLMRQAGRYMKEYRAIREKVSFLDMCKTPDIAAQITMQPVEAFEVDAAIIFADILLPAEAMGMPLSFLESKGPVLERPVRTEADVDALKIADPLEGTPFVMEALKLVRSQLNGRIPLIGFAGSPFTLASYMIEGGHSRNYILAKSMMYNHPELFHKLMDKISATTSAYLLAQVDAGAQVIQLFDSWVGCLSPHDYETYVLEHTSRIIKEIKSKHPDIPVINFGTGNSGMLDTFTKSGGDVIGLDWRINLDAGWSLVGEDHGVQGNLDPVLLFGAQQELEIRVKDILRRANGRPGHIFNLGHGILPQTPVENVKFLIDTVHRLSSS